MIPAAMLLAIAEKENGKPGVWTKNTNGTQDVGALQFNTAYLNTLKKYGITATDVANNGCYAYDLAAWRIRGHLTKDSGEMWTRAANYHSRTPVYNQRYRADLMVRANRWARWLDQFQRSQYATINTYSLQLKIKPVNKAIRVAQATHKTAYVPRRIVVSNPNR